MKKTRLIAIAAILMTALSICMLFSGCCRIGKCAECGQTEKLNHYVNEDNNLDEWACDYCYNMLKLWNS